MAPQFKQSLLPVFTIEVEQSNVVFEGIDGICSDRNVSLLQPELADRRLYRLEEGRRFFCFLRY
ncbi:MAG: hypothetical protein AB1306_10485, partial [Nitrospirota bacterium]